MRGAELGHRTCSVNESRWEPPSWYVVIIFICLLCKDFGLDDWHNTLQLRKPYHRRAFSPYTIHDHVYRTGVIKPRSEFKKVKEG